MSLTHLVRASQPTSDEGGDHRSARERGGRWDHRDQEDSAASPKGKEQKAAAFPPWNSTGSLLVEVLAELGVGREGWV